MAYRFIEAEPERKREYRWSIVCFISVNKADLKRVRRHLHIELVTAIQKDSIVGYNSTCEVIPVQPESVDGKERKAWQVGMGEEFLRRFPEASHREFSDEIDVLGQGRGRANDNCEGKRWKATESSNQERLTVEKPKYNVASQGLGLSSASKS